MPEFQFKGPTWHCTNCGADVPWANAHLCPTVTEVARPIPILLEHRASSRCLQCGASLTSGYPHACLAYATLQPIPPDPAMNSIWAGIGQLLDRLNQTIDLLSRTPADFLQPPAVRTHPAVNAEAAMPVFPEIGMAMNAAVAQHILGWHIITVHGNHYWTGPDGNTGWLAEGSRVHNTFDPCQRIEHAWLVIMEMKRRGLTCTLAYQPQAPAVACWAVHFDSISDLHASSAPLAICRAALYYVHTHPTEPAIPTQVDL